MVASVHVAPRASPRLGQPRRLSLHALLQPKKWGGKRESNPQPPEPQSGALPVELFPPQELHYSNWRRERAPGRREEQSRRWSSRASKSSTGFAQAWTPVATRVGLGWPKGAV